MGLIAQHTIPRGWPYEFSLDLALAAMPLYAQAEDTLGGTKLPAWGSWIQVGIYLAGTGSGAAGEDFCSELVNFKVRMGGLKTPLPAIPPLPNGVPPADFCYFAYTWGGLNILDSVRLSWFN